MTASPRRRPLPAAAPDGAVRRLRAATAASSRLRLPTLLGAVAATALLAGCGSSGVSPEGATPAAAAGSSAATAGDGHGGTLVVGMTASNIPPLDTVLSAAQGYEGVRFIGNQLYDGLTRWDLTQSDTIPKLAPSLATDWKANGTATSWTFTLRQGVTFTDGTPWDADAAIFNLQRYTNPDAPSSSAAIVGQSATLGGGVMKAFRKLGAYRVRIDLKAPDAHLPEDVATLFMGSPTALRKEGAAGFAKKPVGTGPFVLKSVTQGQQATLVPNASYWGPKAKLDQLVLKPMPEPAARLAALRSGSVNWIEYPNPDDLQGLQAGGFQILQNGYDHIWPWVFNTKAKPWDDVRVRQAANYAIDREALATSLLHGTADPAAQIVPKASAAYDAKNDLYTHDPVKAKQLLAAAGHPNGVDLTVEYPTSGSGNMIPGPMNEALQKDLAAVGIRVKLKPIEWAAMLAQLGSGMPKGIDAMNISLTFQSESFWSTFLTSDGPINIGGYSSPAFDAAIAKAQTTVDPAARAALYAQAGAQITKDAGWLYVVNDKNPRALAKTVHGFVEPKSWFADLTSVWVG
ncbi:ABC transporter substrate-binding protein [Patulibacter sp. NPDC049589]|uniref:ABC transporter substrate-binding protein n=1 Tax=Patulibacter sp. NPDC049589 TaxID=3154731 RepID=UPI00342D5805